MVALLRKLEFAWLPLKSFVSRVRADVHKWIVENGHFASNSILNSSKAGCWFHRSIF